MRAILPILLLCISQFAFSQQTLTITQLSTAPVIDGVLNEAVWQEAAVADGFTTTLPQFAQIPKLGTTVKIGFTETGIFVAAICQSQKVRNEGSLRDDYGTGDHFTVSFDTWNDDQNAFSFSINAGGQMLDQRQASFFSGVDFDAPWTARTTHQSDSWTAEIWIPFKALRYPAKGAQDWGLQFTRYDRTSGETSTWSPQNPLIKDAVLQYGDMKGLVTPEKQMRLGLSILRKTGIESNYSTTGVPSRGRDEIETDLAVDGRIGFNSATTLDFSILPALGFTNNGLFAGGQSRFERLISTLPYNMPGPRNLNTEESGINRKSPVDDVPFLIYSSDLSNNFTLQSGQFAFSSINSRLLQEVKFHTRTRSKIGISVSNYTYSRPKYRIYNSSPPFNYEGDQKLPFNPNAHQIDIEKAFRNNSWIQASTKNIIAGKGLNTNNSSISTQWRDKSNQYEAGGYLMSFTQFVPKGSPYSRAEGAAHIGKVNGKYLWNAQYQSPQHYVPYLLKSPNGSQSFIIGFHQINASAGSQNYHPANTNLLNTRQIFSLRAYPGKKPAYREKLYTSYTWSALSKNFRSLSFKAETSPKIQYETLDFVVLKLKDRRSVPLYISATGSTDTRKKTILYYGAGFDWNPYFWQFNPTIHITPSWVFKKSTLTISNDMRLPGRSTRTLTIPANEYLFERPLNWSYETSTAYRLFFNRKWAIQMDLAWAIDVLSNRQVSEITTNGTPIPSDFPVPKRSVNDAFSGSFQLDWYYSPVKHFQLRFYHNTGNENHLAYSNFPFSSRFAASGYDNTLFEWTWVWNINH